MLSIHARQLYAGLVLPAMVFFAVGLVLFGQVWPQTVARLRLAVMGEMTPFYNVLTYPQKQVSSWMLDLHGVTDLAAENTRLREENKKLQHWYHTALGLEEENKHLKAVLHWGVGPAVNPGQDYVSGRVIRDEVGPYLRAVLLDVGPEVHIHRGSTAVDSAGLVGRVSEIGAHVVRILLITDAASRIPVSMSDSGADAMMVGDNSGFPRLMYYPQERQPIEGEKVQTRGQTGMTGNVPVGYVHYLSSGRPVVEPDADLAHLDIVRIFNGVVQNLESPPAEGRVRERAPLGLDEKGNLGAGSSPSMPLTGLRGLQNIWPFSSFRQETESGQ